MATDTVSGSYPVFQDPTHRYEMLEDTMKPNSFTNGELEQDIQRKIGQKGQFEASKSKAMEAKKKRNSRKRNRSDMSPEELRRLRERERKAQQSRRDRIRAQKKQAHGWHDEDAAWEAFLNQNDAPNKKNKQTAIPSMVCAKYQNNKTESPMDVPPPLINAYMISKEEPDSVLHRENGLEKKRGPDTDSNSGSFNDSTVYSSDDSNSYQGDSNKRMSHRHFLPSEELEKLRKRERDAKRKQREKHRIQNSCKENEQSVSPIEKTGQESPDDSKRTSSRSGSGSQSPVYKTTLMSPAKQLNERNAISPYNKTVVSPYRHNPLFDRRDTSPVYHHSSPTHYISRLYTDVHYPSHHGGHYHPDPYPDHFSQQHHPSMPTSGVCNSPEKREEQSPPSDGSNEKKRMVSRNVDRKKLSEEELEDLRRRERDYQRERRARIRMEKAKMQVGHDIYDHKSRHESYGHYYHSPHYYHTSHELSLSGKLKSYEHESMYARHNYYPNKFVKEYSEGYMREKELAVAIPHKYERKQSEEELLQVVPKTRDEEGRKLETEKKKGFLEDICSALKKESSWKDEDEDDDRLVIVQPNCQDADGLLRLKQEFPNELVKPKSSLALDQLERRRRSNREAQRRRRARLKMQGEELSLTTDGMEFDHEKHVDGDERGCPVKMSAKADMHYHPYKPHFLPEHEIRHEYHFHYPSQVSSERRAYYHEPSYFSDRYAHERNQHHHHHHHHHEKQMSIDLNRSSPHRDEYPSKASVSFPAYSQENEAEPSKLCNRKRKQTLPRKIVSSTGSSPEGDVDVCTLGRSPDLDEDIEPRSPLPSLVVGSGV